MPEEVHAAHILVDTEKEADEIMKKIEEGEDFETLAMKYSKCPSKQDGGDLGWFGQGVMVQEFEQAAFSTKPGKFVKVKTEFGWHIIKVLGTRDSEE
jgi:peptidyl-prolyl cis-trans isomerase C